MRVAEERILEIRLLGIRHCILVVSQITPNAVNKREGVKLHFESFNCSPSSPCSSSIATPIEAASEEGD